MYIFGIRLTPGRPCVMLYQSRDGAIVTVLRPDMDAPLISSTDCRVSTR